MVNGKSKNFVHILAFALPQLLLIAYVLFIAYPLLVGEGLPSFTSGVYRDSTIAFYIAWAKLVDTDGLFTSAWCGGFDLIRFYPPIALSMLYFLGKIVGSYELGGYISFFIALNIFALAVYTFIRTTTGSSLGALIGAISTLTISGYVATIAVYWEYTRILGEALMLYSLSYLYKLTFYSNNSRDAIIAGVFVGLTALTHLMAFLELTVLGLITVCWALYNHIKSGIDADNLRHLIARLSLALMVMLSLSLWWLIPASIPFGLQHYMRIRGNYVEVVNIYLYGFKHLVPPTWVPTIQAPYFILGLSAAILFLLIRKRVDINHLYMFSLAILTFLYGQGTRLIPTLGLTIVATIIGLTKYLPSRYRLAVLLILACTAITYTAIYIGEYHKGLLIDNTYIFSDEYKIAQYLSKSYNGERVYLMYGDILRGNQWVNVFAPNIKQVLSGYMEGCLVDEYQRLDYAIKYTMNSELVKKLLLETNTRYLAIDKKWYEETVPNVIEELVEEGFLQPVNEINDFLKYSILFKVNSTTFENKYELKKDTLLTPARVLGIALNTVVLYTTYRLKRRIQAKDETFSNLQESNAIAEPYIFNSITKTLNT